MVHRVPPEGRERGADPRAFRRRVIAGWLLLLGVHVALFFEFSGAQLLSATPYFGHDFNTHIEQTWRVLEGLRGWGESWVYDVQLLAGQPNGVFFDADNKAWELWTYALTLLGVPQGLAFNSFIVAVHASVPVTMGWCARRFGLGHFGAWCAALFGVLLWFFDSWNHWCWYVGMVAYAGASFAFLVPLAAYWRWLETRKAAWWVVAAGALTGVHLLHPYSFFMLAPSMVVMTWRRREALGRAGMGKAAMIAAVTVLGNAWWLVVAARFWHYILDSSFFGHGGLPFLVADFLGLMIDPSSTGLLGTRTMIRLALVLMAFIAWWQWRKDKAPLAAVFGPFLIVMVAFVYLGAYTPLVQIQPYRHVGPLGFGACIPAAALVERRWRDRRSTPLPAAWRSWIWVLGLVASLGLVREVMYFVGGRLPAPKPVPGTQRSILDMSGYPWTPRYHYERMPLESAAEWVRSHDDGTGRFLVEGPLFGEYFAWSTRAQILGGFTQRNLQHSWANLFRWSELGDVSSAQLRRYVDAYAVHYVVVTTPQHDAPWWDEHPRVLKRVGQLGLWRLYEVREPTGFVASGPGRVHASTNLLEVRGTDPQTPVRLRYHWLETLACRPDCAVEVDAVEGRRAPMIEIPAPHPADFEVYNGY